MPKTSITNGHFHYWNKTSNITTINQGHSHKIDSLRRLAAPNKKGGHSHRLDI